MYFVLIQNWVQQLQRESLVQQIKHATEGTGHKDLYIILWRETKTIKTEQLGKSSVSMNKMVIKCLPRLKKKNK